MKVYAIDGIVPVVDPAAYVHPSAVLIGDVVVGAGAYVGPCASLRGDFGRLFIGVGANVQDCCVMHGFPGSYYLGIRLLDRSDNTPGPLAVQKIEVPYSRLWLLLLLLPVVAL